VAVVPHGQRVDIIQVRRRFVRVRTAAGIEGWTDSRQLLTPSQMARLERLVETAAQLPPQGWAHIADPLNLHTEPSRYSPSLYQMPENTVVSIIGHAVSARVAPKTPPELLPKPAPRKARKPKEKEKDKEKSRGSRVPPPPMPAPPKPPANWLDLSKTNEPPEAEKEPDEPAAPAKPIPTDDWSLVRTRDNRVGWVLSRPLMMGIPDDVAQYAEGHHISSFFPLGEIQDEGTPHKHWLWTTVRQLGQPYEFDGFRVFTWNANRHRYETAYRERDLIGYYPVRLFDAEITENRKQVKAVGFAILSEDSTGQGWCRRYAFYQNRVRFLGKEPVKIAKHTQDLNLPPIQTMPIPGVAPAPKPQSWRERVTSWWRHLFQ
jgi:hypothetical protein